jgi:hypothetical protein
MNFYSSDISRFIKTDTPTIIGILTEAAQKQGFYQQMQSQTRAWRIEIDLLKEALAAIKHSIEKHRIILEYPIPRRGRRIDAVIVAPKILLVIEFKIGSNTYDAISKSQVEDYCLDLRDFHETSNGIRMVPILVATEGSVKDEITVDNGDIVSSVHLANSHNLSRIISGLLQPKGYSTKKLAKWETGVYQPTPTIVDAAQHLYARMNVEEIARSDAGGKNLSLTTNAVLKAVLDAKAHRKKVICFITGVPGSGKTLAGLNVVHNPQLHKESDLGVFLSGNGPLVKVLQEALARDHRERTGEKLDESRRRVKTFIQNVHNFLDAYTTDVSPPVDHVVLFDEAQRAWDQHQSMTKFGRDYSESELMLSIMDRHSDWAAIIALVGSGQEINTGEAGLREWGRVLETRFQHWEIHVSPDLYSGADDGSGQSLFCEPPNSLKVKKDEALHLNVSVRSYRAEKVSEWVTSVLDGKPDIARAIHDKSLSNYPIVLTRDLQKAKKWLTDHRRGMRRSGVIASSGARRLRAYGVDVKLDLDVANWFLNPLDDVRSSSFLEVPATEFGIQGLELDWICVCWGADLRRKATGWSFNRFSGTKWQTLRNEVKMNYLINKYRVLLTRAREGMVIWIPRGSKADKTLDSQFYNGTATYLKKCGVAQI